MKQVLTMVLAGAMVLQPMTSFMGYVTAMAATDARASVTIDGYQISSTIGGYRTVYSVNDPGKEIAKDESGTDKVGMLYGIEGHVSNPDTEMVIGSTNKDIYKYAATSNGKSQSGQTYVMTMKFIDSVTAEFFNTKLYVRAYAQLKDGTYIYSSARTLTIFQVADVLYQKMLMNNASGHNYLYTNILSIADSNYTKKDYNYHQSIVSPDDEDRTTEKPTEKPTEIQTEKPTEESTEKPTEKPTQSPEEPEEISNLSQGKTATASSTVWNYTASNAVDGDVNTYWEGQGGNQTLSINLGSDSELSYIIVKLNPDYAWSARTQRIEVLGHTQYETGYTTMVAATDYQFNPTTGNQIKIPVSGKASSVQLKFISNTGSGSGQAAEVEIYGVPADNPDLTITGIAANKTTLYENENLVCSAVVKNRGTKDAATTALSLYLGEEKFATADVKSLKPGESTTIEIPIGTLDAGEYSISAIVDEDNNIIEKKEDNNSIVLSDKITVKEVESVDIVPIASWTPSNPGTGDEVEFVVTITNRGNQNTSDASHGVTVKVKDESGNIVKTFTKTANGKINVNDSVSVTMGKWTAGEGKYTIDVAVDSDSGELDVKRNNNSVSSSLYVGRGANMPFITVEAEAPGNRTNGTKLAQNRNLADYAGEASGRSAVLLDSNGEYVEFTLPSEANAVVLRASIPKGTDGTVSVYANDSKVGKINLTTNYSYHMGSPTSLGNLGYGDNGSTAYWLYDDGQILLDKVYPAGTKIKIQKDSDDVSWVYCDMVEFEKVAEPLANPDPSRYVDASKYTSIEQAVNAARQDSNCIGVYIPAGEWEMSGHVYLYGKGLDIVGAGMWYTKLIAKDANSSAGFYLQSGTDGTKIRELSAWSKRRSRSDGPEGKFINTVSGVNNITIDHVWVEHFTCLYWGVNASHNTFTNCRMKNTLADGINMTNGSNYNVISNCYARGTGDDSFALFSAADSGGSINTGNVYSNLTAVCVRRAAAFAVYGGEDNTFKNLYAADTLTYPGLTVNSYSFSYQAYGFGDKMTYIDGITLDRCGGDYWTSNGSDDHINDYQNFGAIWVYSGDRELKNVKMSNIDINDPTYFGIMIQTMYQGGPLHSMSNVNFENITINNPGRYGVKFNICAEQGQGPVVGSFDFKNVIVNNAKVQSMYGLSGCPDCKITKTDCNW